MLSGALEQPVARHGLKRKGGSPPGSSLEGKEMRGAGGRILVGGQETTQV